MSSVNDSGFITRSSSRLSRSAPPSLSARARRWTQNLLSRNIAAPLDRIRELGNDEDYGHTGCVNAISWAQDGQLLLTGGDDTTVRLWRVDPTNLTDEYPLVCTSVIETGHIANIFAAHMLPHSTRIATCAGDGVVRVSDIGHGPVSGTELETRYATATANVATFRCHSQATKRVLLEDSPDTFLSVAEDGRVRQHDLRAPPHPCRSGNVRRRRFGSSGDPDLEPCGPPLVQVPHSLTAISSSPLAPHHFVVAGESNFGYLFDRRQTGRRLEYEWGVPVDAANLTTCVRRFARPDRGMGEYTGYEHITGARMAVSNAHEVLFSYSADAVYLFSTLDDPLEAGTSPSPGILTPNSRTARTRSPSPPAGVNTEDVVLDDDSMDEEDIGGDDDEEAWEDEGDEGGELLDEERGESERPHSRIPVVLPRARYAGAANVQTVKDVNFFGPQDEFVLSGSDDGHFFVWRKGSPGVWSSSHSDLPEGHLHGIYEGDGSVVNVMESHPSLPLLAVSGIDTTVKLFAPARGPSRYSRLANANTILSRNKDSSRRRPMLSNAGDLAQLLMHYNLSVQSAGGAGEGATVRAADCVNQ